MPPSKYVPDEFQNSMFLPQMKKASMGGIGGGRQNLCLDMRYSAPPPPPKN